MDPSLQVKIHDPFLIKIGLCGVRLAIMHFRSHSTQQSALSTGEIFSNIASIRVFIGRSPQNPKM